MIRFETESDLQREKKAIELFTKTFNLRYVKLNYPDIDYKILDSNGEVIGYAEVKGRIRSIRDAFPLPIALRKLVKLMDKHMKPIVIWACEDGILYADIRKIYGTVRFGGRPNRVDAVNDEEMMAYYDKQDNIRYIRYT
jgi:hypothetical protein